MTIQHVLEGDLTEEHTEALGVLLNDSFPNVFQGRIYFKQLPHSRLLLLENGAILGQLGLDLRVIRVGEKIVRSLGIIDLCVQTSARGRGHGQLLLQSAEDLGKRWKADFLLLFADQPDLYTRNGFTAVESGLTSFLAVEDRTSFAMIERDWSGIMFAKPLGNQAWPTGKIDLLGYLF